MFRRVLILAMAGVFAFVGCAAAADMAPVAKAPPPRVLQSFYGAGFYYGVHTFAETEKITPVIGDTALGGNFAAGAAVGLTAGYLWGGNGVSWQALEVMASYKNISAAATGAIPVVGVPLMVDSRWSFTQRFKIGGPADVMLALLPNLGTVFPALPAPPGGVGTMHPYLFGAVHEDDISESIGISLGRAWRIKGGFGAGMMQTIGRSTANPNGAAVVVDVWAEYIPPASSVTIGAGDLVKTNAGRETRFGMSVLY